MNLVIDSTIVAATRSWVINTITAAYLIPGGFTGQVLAKASNAAGDFIWVSPTAALNITVDTVKEVQTAAAGQDTFDLALCTTTGLSAYIEGIRDYATTNISNTRVKLSRTLTAGTHVEFVQNAPNNAINVMRTRAALHFQGQS